MADKQNAANAAWSVVFTTPMAQSNRDYAIVTRVCDPKTEQTAIIVAGIASWGTLARVSLSPERSTSKSWRN